MKPGRREIPWGLALGLGLALLLTLPLAALALSTSPQELLQGLQSRYFAPALWLSLRTSLISLGLVVLCGTPLSWWLARSPSPWSRALGVLVELPVVVPPAVVGVALLQTFGRRGLLGPALEALGVELAFSQAAVVVAQVVVSAPFFVQAASSAFAGVEEELLLVARTLGASRRAAFFRVALPLALPGLVAGASLSWARSLGEFGATLLFAGNLPGRTQTLPLAIFSALEGDVRAAVALSLVLAALGALLLLGLRAATAARRPRGPA